MPDDIKKEVWKVDFTGLRGKKTQQTNCFKVEAFLKVLSLGCVSWLSVLCN